MKYTLNGGRMNRKRFLCMMRSVWVVLLLAAFSFTPGFAATLPDDADPPGEEVDDELQEPVNTYCETPDAYHPVGNRIAELFDVAYEDVMAWFCVDEMGFGQIMLALKTAQVADEDAGDLLARRADGEGWGVIWQDLGFIGRGRTKHADAEDAAASSSENAEAPEDNRGRPEAPGASKDKNHPNGVGPGENRGRHVGADHSKGRGHP